MPDMHEAYRFTEALLRLSGHRTALMQAEEEADDLLEKIKTGEVVPLTLEELLDELHLAHPEQGRPE